MSTTVDTPVTSVATRSAAAWPAVVGLLAVTAGWGSTFVLLADATRRIPAADHLAVRFALAALVLATVRPRGVVTMPAILRRRAVLLGLLFGTGNLLLTTGLETTAPSVSGFVTGMYVVFTPLLAALVFGERLTARIAVAIALATAGLAVMSLTGGAGVGRGELLTLLGAAVFAVHIVALGAWTDARFAVELAVIQSAVTAVLAGVLALPGGITLPATRGDRLAMLYMAVVVGAVTMLLQTWSQSRLHPSRAAVVMTLEPVWAAVFAIALGAEQLGWRTLVGGGAVLSAMYLCEAGPAPARVQDEEPDARGRREPAPRRAWRSPLPRRRSSSGSSRTGRSTAPFRTRHERPGTGPVLPDRRPAGRPGAGAGSPVGRRRAGCRCPAGVAGDRPPSSRGRRDRGDGRPPGRRR